MSETDVLVTSPPLITSPGDIARLAIQNSCVVFPIVVIANEDAMAANNNVDAMITLLCIAGALVFIPVTISTSPLLPSLDFPQSSFWMARGHLFG